MRRLALAEFVLDDERRDLGIGLGRKRVALGGEFLAQRPEILDDAVVDDREPRRSVRVGVGLGGLAVRRPAGVADADRPAERRRRKFRLQVLELALGAPPRQPAVLERRDARGIVAAVFEPLQRIDNRARDRPASRESRQFRTCENPLSEIDPAGQALGQWRPPPQVKFGEGM